MDRFYLENAGLYSKLISSIDPELPAPHFSRHGAAPLKDDVAGEQYNPTTVVAVRVRPMLEEDLAAGFPRAVYPRTARQDGAQIVDIHDLYNHPRGRPVIKVPDRSTISSILTDSISQYSVLQASTRQGLWSRCNYRRDLHRRR